MFSPTTKPRRLFTSPYNSSSTLKLKGKALPGENADQTTSQDEVDESSAGNNLQTKDEEDKSPIDHILETLNEDEKLELFSKLKKELGDNIVDQDEISKEMGTSSNDENE